MSNTCAVSVLTPPVGGTIVGLAASRTAPTAALPMAILIALLPLALAPPEIAVIVAMPFAPPALKVAVAMPFVSVCTFDGWIVPSVVVNVICVPLCGGWPDASITCAVICAVPLTGSAVTPDVSVMVDPDGASSGTFWHDAARSATAARTGPRRKTRGKRGTMKTLSILVPMKLQGQAGYAMAALLVAMSIMAVMLTVAMPVWRQMVQREKEEELVFRGMQYAHAIGMFQRKYANAYPPSFDVLVNERFLRKKFKDPITNDDFAPILAGTNVPGAPTGGGAAQPGASGRGAQQAPAPMGQSSGPGAPARGGPGTPAVGGPGGAPVGGIMGVTSKSKDKSIRIYNGRSHYNEWQFVWTQQTQTPGAGAAGAGAPGQPGRGQQSPFTPSGGGPAGQRGRGGQGGGRGGPSGPGRGFNPFQPSNPQQPITPGRGRG